MKTKSLICLMVLIFSCGIAFSQNFVGNWPIDELSGDSVYDASGNVHTGISISASIEEGVLGNCRVLDGTSSQIDLGSDLAYRLHTPFSFSFWVKVQDPSRSQFILSNAGGYKGFWLINQPIDGHGYFNFNLQGGGYWSYGPTSHMEVLPNIWYHVVGVAYSDTELSLYVNGVLDNSAVIIPGYNPNVTTHLKAGVDANLGGYRLNGSIDEIIIYDFALSAEEVQGLYNDGIGLCNFIPGDVNGDCHANGIDIVYFVNFLKGGPELIRRTDCE